MSVLLKPGDTFPDLDLTQVGGEVLHPEPHHLQATRSVLDPEGRVEVGVCSSGAIGRVTAEDAVGLIRYAQSHAA